MTQSIKLTRITNGWLLDWSEEQDDESEHDQHWCCEDKGASINEEAQALAEAFAWIANHFDMGYRKHHLPNEQFVKVSLVDGDKYWDDEMPDDESDEE